MTPEAKDQTLPKRFIFLGGAEGSGTTLLLRLLSAATTCTSLGGNYFKIPEHPAAKPLTDAFNAAHADQRYATELPAAQRDWLEAFFDGRRRRQWETLRASEFAV